MRIVLALSVFIAVLINVRWTDGQRRVYSRDLEVELRTLLYTDYEVLQRPSKRVIVKVGFNLLSIRYLDIKEQNLAVSGYFMFEWIDDRLQWNKLSDYDNVPFLFSSELLTWRPSIIVENSVSDIDVISKPQVLMRVVSNGLILWTPGGVLVTYCVSDITYYPLDTQTCDIIISSWAYTAGEIFLVIWEDGLVMNHYQEHGEWEVMAVSNTTLTTHREKQSFSRVKFTMTLRRRPLFHVLNTIFPFIMMAFLTVMVFKLPVESGERVGLSLTILLAYAVYLTLISDNIPQTSVSASLLSAYLPIILTLSALSVILTIVILDIYFTSEEKPVPVWLQDLTKYVLAKVVCYKRPGHEQKQTPKPERHSPLFTRTCKVSPEQSTSESFETDSIQDGADAVEDKNGSNNLNSKWNKLEDDVISFKSLSDVEGINKEVADFSWKEIAVIIDKIFLFSFFMLVLGSTVGISVALVTHYLDAY